MNNKKDKPKILLFKNIDKSLSYINSIPKQYKRNDYIIDKLNCKKKNVER